jgi:hypothetical protein
MSICLSDILQKTQKTKNSSQILESAKMSVQVTFSRESQPAAQVAAAVQAAVPVAVPVADNTIQVDQDRIAKLVAKSIEQDVLQSIQKKTDNEIREQKRIADEKIKEEKRLADAKITFEDVLANDRLAQQRKDAKAEEERKKAAAEREHINWRLENPARAHELDQQRQAKILEQQWLLDAENRRKCEEKTAEAEAKALAEKTRVENEIKRAHEAEETRQAKLKESQWLRDVEAKRHNELLVVEANNELLLAAVNREKRNDYMRAVGVAMIGSGTGLVILSFL